MTGARHGGLRAAVAYLIVGILAVRLALGAGSPALAGSGSGSGGGSGGSGSGSGSGGGSGSASRGDFTLGANYQPPTFVGHLVRGGLTSCPGCTTAVEPRYVGASFSCFYDSNSLGLASLNDFSGTVTLEVLDLPPGVTSQTATSVVVPRRGAASTPLWLRADSGAALGSATVAVRTTSGALVHTLRLPISVADQLPPCP